MIIYRTILISTLVIFVSACTSARVFSTVHNNTRTSRKFVTKTDTTSGDSFLVNTSFYAHDFHGKVTANGETFDMYGMTAAHRTLPFDTRIKVTNPSNNKSVILRINDRGPFIEGRDLDISYGAAKRIGLINHGVKELLVEIID